jgi:hypothetical protein
LGIDAQPDEVKTRSGKLHARRTALGDASPGDMFLTLSADTWVSDRGTCGVLRVLSARAGVL